MASVGVFPLMSPDEIEPDRRPPWVLPLSSGVCVPGRKLDVQIGAIGREVGAISGSELRSAEEAWIDLLALDTLLQLPPEYPAAGPGGNYPRWARTYYVRKHTGGQRKFYVVFSPDGVNAAAPAVTLVRLTSTPSGPEFPEVQPGTHACAGNITTFPAHFVDTVGAPPVRSVSLDGMRRVAAAVAITHGLGPALGRSERELGSLTR